MIHVPDLDNLVFSQARDAYPERYDKADLAASQLVDQGSGMFVVKRDGADAGHVCHLIESCGQAWGRCECDGYNYNDGPCSHLCALWRASHEGLITIPGGRIVRASVEIVDVDEERAQTDAEPEQQPLRADGGIR